MRPPDDPHRLPVYNVPLERESLAWTKAVEDASDSGEIPADTMTIGNKPMGCLDRLLERE
jgi:hypothetical protein